MTKQPHNDQRRLSDLTAALGLGHQVKQATILDSLPMLQRLGAM